MQNIYNYFSRKKNLKKDFLNIKSYLYKKNYYIHIIKNIIFKKVFNKLRYE